MLFSPQIIWGLKGYLKKQSQFAKYHDGVHFVSKKDPLEVRVLEQTDNYPENVNREPEAEKEVNNGRYRIRTCDLTGVIRAL